MTDTDTDDQDVGLTPADMEDIDLTRCALRYDELEDLPVIESGWTADLVWRDTNTKIWLARTTSDDGEPFWRTVCIEGLLPRMDDMEGLNDE